MAQTLAAASVKPAAAFASTPLAVRASQAFPSNPAKLLPAAAQTFAAEKPAAAAGQASESLVKDQYAYHFNSIFQQSDIDERFRLFCAGREMDGNGNLAFDRINPEIIKWKDAEVYLDTLVTAEILPNISDMRLPLPSPDVCQADRGAVDLRRSILRRNCDPGLQSGTTKHVIWAMLDSWSSSEIHDSCRRVGRIPLTKEDTQVATLHVFTYSREENLLKKQAFSSIETRRKRTQTRRSFSASEEEESLKERVAKASDNHATRIRSAREKHAFVSRW